MGMLSADIGRARDNGILSQDTGHMEVDSLWTRWCEMAADELTESTGEEIGGLWQPYEYAWKGFIAEAKRGCKENASDGKDSDANSAEAWMHMRHCDALMIAEGKTPPHEWSHRIRWRAGILDLAHPEAGLKQVFDILENPGWAGAETQTR